MKAKKSRKEKLMSTDNEMKKARTLEEFAQCIKEGKPFEVKGIAEIHVVCIDEEKPPILKIKGNEGILTHIMTFALSEMMEKMIKNGEDREKAEEIVRFMAEAAIDASRFANTLEGIL